MFGLYRSRYLSAGDNHVFSITVGNKSGRFQLIRVFMTLIFLSGFTDEMNWGGKLGEPT